MRRKGVVIGLLTLLAVSCQDGSPLQPRSSGRPYEVLLVGDRDSVVYRLLDRDVAGLPQPEPSFDLSEVSPERFEQAGQLARAVVMLEIDDRQYTQPAVRYEKNTYARPQLIIHLRTPSLQAVSQRSERLGTALREMLNRYELDVAVASLKKAHRTQAEAIIRERFGVRMLIPADMTSMKQGRDFLWLSNNAATGMQNLCVYRLPERSGGTMTGTERLAAWRDSVMRRNIPGERSGMYMQTVGGSLTQEREVTRGLWEMRGDAMGGPFVARCFPRGDSLLVVEAFVYAPEMRKRNRLRALEAVLYTVDETGGTPDGGK